MNWFKKNKEQPKNGQNVSLFEPLPGTLLFAFVRPALHNIASSTYQVAPPDLNPKPDAIAVAGGRYYEYTSESKSGLALVSMPCVSETGDVKSVQIRKLYLDYALTSLAANLGLDFQSFFHSLVEGKRAIVAGIVPIDPPKLIYSAPHQALEALSVSERDLATNSALLWLFYLPSRAGFLSAEALGPLKTTGEEYFFSYTATTTSSDKEGVNELEAIVRYCISNNLSALPLQGHEHWCSGFIQPALEHMKVKMKELEGKSKNH